MSYDIEIIVDHADGYRSTFDVGNMTYNVSRMTLEAVGQRLSFFDGMDCETACPFLAELWQVMKRDPDRFRRVEVSDWGSYDNFMPYLTRFYAMVRLHPRGGIRVY